MIRLTRGAIWDSSSARVPSVEQSSTMMISIFLTSALRTRSTMARMVFSSLKQGMMTDRVKSSLLIMIWFVILDTARWRSSPLHHRRDACVADAGGEQVIEIGDGASQSLFK